VTCYTCYGKGHYSPDCTADPNDYVTVIANFVNLPSHTQAVVPRISFDNAILRVQNAAERTSAQMASRSGKE